MQINHVFFNVELQQILNDLSRVNKYYFQRGFRDNGEYIMMQCPFHKDGQERRMSAGIRKDNGTFHCFACGEVHSLPEFISYCFNDSDMFGKVGWNWLLKNYSTVKVEERELINLDLARFSMGNNHNERGFSSDRDIFVTEEELERYRYIHSYMYERGLTDEIIEIFDIGYDVSNKTITFPVKDLNGDCLFVARRSVRQKFYSYPKGAEKPLYGLYELSYYSNRKVIGERSYPEEVIVCEGMFDALSCWVYGKPAVALNGLGSPLQFYQLRSLPCRKLILALDNDEWGERAKKRIRQKVTNKIITEYILPKGKKDINDLTAEEFALLQEIF